MDREALAARLGERFDATPAQCRVVVRQAGDLDDDGRYEATHGGPLTAEDVVANLAEAPADLDLVERWNWWVGAMHLAHDGFARFTVARYRAD